MSFNIFIDKLKEEKSPVVTFWVNKVTVKSLHSEVDLSQTSFKTAKSEVIYQKEEGPELPDLTIKKTEKKKKNTKKPQTLKDLRLAEKNRQKWMVAIWYHTKPHKIN